MAYDKVRRHLFLSSMDATFLHGVLEMHDFDPGTGVVSDPRLLNNNHTYFRLCISPDASKLYTTGNTAPGFSVLKQFDVTLPSAQDIFNSGVTIYSSQSDHLADIEIGPDSMIYGVPMITSNSLFRIASPNMPGMACNFAFNAIALLPGSHNMTGLPSPSITRFSPPDIPDETYTHDAVFCGASITLTSPDTTYYDYVWSTGDTGIAVSITQSGIYWVTSFTDCRKRVDTFNVMDFELEPKVHDTVICFASSAVLTAPVNLPGYLWSDGSTGSQLTITQPGTYWVFATDFCIETVDTFHVSFVDFDVELPGDTTVCDDITINASVTVDGATYKWQDGSSANSYIVNASGQYWVEASKDGCKKADTMLVNNHALSIDLGNDVLLCDNASVTLKVQAAGASYTWQDGSTGNEYKVNTAGTYSVYGSNNVCTATDTVNVDFEKCDCLFSVPSVFSPNGDGRNDQFHPLIEAACPVSDYSFLVFNRWGEVVFSSRSQGEKWDGKYKGQLADIGTYMYLLNFKGAKGKIFFAKGDVTLVR
jgi:gliding motility-associated-like protein